ncbi:hypothetical protein LTR17_022367 [Elasticomyces elasticus]|nr:hypothetical protein LTR17_022367 [Elasticomyces elasticus]
MDASIRMSASTALAHALTFPDRPQFTQGGTTITPTNIAAKPIFTGYAGRAKLNTKEEHVRSILNSSQLEEEGMNLRFLHRSQSKNGFVYAVMQAYDKHHHLRIRPEDIWIAILSQSSAYTNGHGEELRHHFVAHEDKKKLEVKANGTRYTVDFGALVTALGQLVHENVVDPQLREWVMPAFSTTSKEDIFVSSVIMMGAMKKYF